MIITIFGATGMVGKQLVRQALAEGYTVRAFGRNVESLIDKDLNNDQLIAIKGFVFDAPDVLHAIEGAGAVLSVLGGGFDGTDKTRSLGIQKIVEQMKVAKISRIIALGGLGILNAPKKGLLIDDPNYPEIYKAVGLEHLSAFKTLDGSNLQWSFICAPNILDQELTKKYITAPDFPPVPNFYEIASGDIADCMLEELKNNSYVHHRVGISRS